LPTFGVDDAPLRLGDQGGQEHVLAIEIARAGLARAGLRDPGERAIDESGPGPAQSHRQARWNLTGFVVRWLRLVTVTSSATRKSMVGTAWMCCGR
jgi:hypothetical protein